MANRFKALFMLLIVGLILPVAGSPQRFCMHNFTLVAPGEQCPARDHEKSCDCDGSGDSPVPCCLTAAKFLPDALTPDHFVLSAPAAFPLPVFDTPEPTAAALFSIFPRRIHGRGPPGDLPLYLLNRSLIL